MTPLANIGHVDDFITPDVRDLLDDMVSIRRRIQHDYRGPIVKYAEMVVSLIHTKYDIPEDELRELLLPKSSGDPPHVYDPPEKPKKVTKAAKALKAAKGPEVLSEDCTACMKIKNRTKGPRGKHTCGWEPDGEGVVCKPVKAPKEDHGTCACHPKGVKCERPATKLEVTGEYAGQWACNACWHCPRCPIMLETGKPCKERCVKDWKFQTCKFHGTKWFREDLPAGANPQGVEETNKSESSQESNNTIVEETVDEQVEETVDEQVDETVDEQVEATVEEPVVEMSEKERKMEELRAQLAAMEAAGEGPKEVEKPKPKSNTFKLTESFLEEGGDDDSDDEDMMKKFGYGNDSDEESDDESDSELPVFTSRKREDKPKVKIQGFTRGK